MAICHTGGRKLLSTLSRSRRLTQCLKNEPKLPPFFILTKGIYSVTFFIKRQRRGRLFMKKILFIMVVMAIMGNALFAYARDISFTQEDRDRIIRLEEGQKSLQRQIDDLKISTQRQFDNLYTLILWGFGILFGGMGILIGFVLWDRRTALAPAIKKNKELEERGDLLERALKEFAKQEPRLAEVLRTMRLM